MMKKSVQVAEVLVPADRDDRLRETVERRMREAKWIVPDDKIVVTECIYLPCAVAVAVEMIERERRFDRKDIVWMLRSEVAGLEKRAEAAEKALAERGHVAGCYCHGPEKQTCCGGLCSAHADARCAPSGGKP